MKKEKIYISTIADDASSVAQKYGLGLEIAEYCTAWNMDSEFEKTDKNLREKLDGIQRRVLHAPFNELFPCAVDRQARALAANRYRQAIALARTYGADKVIIHGGYNPWIYYPNWYVEESVRFWKDFLKDDPGVEIALENVLETRWEWIPNIIEGVDHPNLRMCLDVGHVNAYSRNPAMDWLENCAPYISHFHIHNNDGSGDTHSPLSCGSIPMRELLCRAEKICPDATFTLELMEAEPSVCWLLEE